MFNISNQIKKAELFRDLHYKKEPLILPNIWEPLGALLLEDIGYKAIATASTSIAFTNGLNDGEIIPFDTLLNQLSRIANSVSVPVSADIEKGYAKDDKELAQNINSLIDAGIIGINIEDTDAESHKLVDINSQCDKIKLIREVAEQRGIHLFINARIDSYISSDNLSHSDKLDETRRRAEAYKKAGADCYYPIIIKDIEHIKTLLEKVQLPINVTVLPGIPDLNLLKSIGVQRLSLASSFFKITVKAMKDLATKLQSLDGLDEINANEINSDYIEHLLGNSLLK